jgi:hypothetical protein
VAAIRKGPQSITKVTRRISGVKSQVLRNPNASDRSPKTLRTTYMTPQLGELLTICYRSPCLSPRLTRRLRSSRLTKKVSTINSPPDK